jgi:hypothetical protein
MPRHNCFPSYASYAPCTQRTHAAILLPTEEGNPATQTKDYLEKILQKQLLIYSATINKDSKTVYYLYYLKIVALFL